MIEVNHLMKEKKQNDAFLSKIETTNIGLEEAIKESI